MRKFFNWKILSIVIIVTLVTLYFSRFLTGYNLDSRSGSTKIISPEEAGNYLKYVNDGDLIFLNTSLDVKYVGSKNCQKCHLELYDSHMKSQTGRSMAILDSTNIIEEFPQKKPVYDSSKNYFYEMVQQNGKYYQREYRLDRNGNLLHEQLLEAQYIVGSGTNLRYYLNDENGMLYQLPLAWYVHKKKWDFAPGYAEYSNARFSRFLGPMCLSCHNGYMDADSNSSNRYNRPMSFGIGCEACHGPGDIHSRQFEGEYIENLRVNTLTIVNPAKLSPQRRNDICLQCHMEGIAWALQGDQGWFDFRPGMLLENHRSVYTRASENVEAFTVANSGTRLFKSRCYTGSQGNMYCDTCHDSHGALKMEKVMFNRQNCLRCHPIESVPKRASRLYESRMDCKRCHMNQTGKENTLHGVMNHDHWIRIDADKDEINWHSERELAKKRSLIRLMPVVDAKDNRQELRLGIAYAEMYWGEGNSVRAYLDSALHYLSIGLKKNAENAKGLFYKGRVLDEFNRFKDAVAHFKQSLKIRPENAETHFWLGKAYDRKRDYYNAIENYRKATKLKSDEPTYLQFLGVSLYKTGQIDEAAKVLEKALKIDSNNANIYNSLGNIYIFKYGQPDKALFYFQNVVDIDPDFENGYINIGNVYGMMGKYQSAIEFYKKEILTRPLSAFAYYNLGRVFKLKGNPAESQKAYKAALLLDPNLKVPE